MASGSIRERKTKKGNSWQITIEDGSDPVTGERNRTYYTFHGTKKQAEKEMNRRIQEIENGGIITKNTTVKLGAWMNEWVDLYCKHLSPTTVDGYRTAIKSQINPYLGDIPLKQLKNTHIQTWINALSDRGLSPKTIKNAFLNLKSALDKAVTLQMISNNPCNGTVLPKAKKYEAEIYDDDEIRKLLHCAVNTDLYFPLLLIISTGLRRGELLSVR